MQGGGIHLVLMASSNGGQWVAGQNLLHNHLRSNLVSSPSNTREPIKHKIWDYFQAAKDLEVDLVRHHDDFEWG